MDANNKERPGAKQKGWFSRRNKTSEARDLAWERIREAERAAGEEADERAAERQEAEDRGPLSLLRRLDLRLGTGKGAKKERAKLLLRRDAEKLGVDVSDIHTFAQLRGRIAMAKAKAEVSAVK